MAKKKTNYLLIAGIAAVGFYLWKRSVAQPAGSTPLPGSAINPTMPTVAPLVSAPVSQPATTGFLATVAQVFAPAPAPVTASGTTVPGDVRTWVESLDAANQAQANKALLIMPQSEIDSLEDIVHNDFYGNGITTPAQRTFWDMWRVKYHVLDGTYA